MLELEKELLKLHWSEENKKLQEVLADDQKTYFYMGTFFLLASIPLWFYYAGGMFLSVPIGVLALFTYFRNKTKKPYAWLVTIKSKEIWQAQIRGAMDKDPNKNVRWLYLMGFELYKAYTVEELRLEKTEDAKAAWSHMVVNPDIYKCFTEGEHVLFIFSPSHDLIGYYHQGTVKLLIREEVLSNGENYRLSISIPQELGYPPGGGYSRVE